MRIMVMGPPKTGNVWVKSLFAEIYSLSTISPPPNSVKALIDFVNQGRFIKDSIFHQHLPPHNDLLNLGEICNIFFSTVLRNPYDTFVSLYYFAQNYPKKFSKHKKLRQIVGKSIDHPDVYHFLGKIEHGFGSNLLLAKSWVDCDQTIVIRYENLKKDPLLELQKVVGEIKLVEDERIYAAIQACSLEKMRNQDDKRAKHFRKGTVGDWKNHLTSKHLEIFRSEYSEIIEYLGYDVM